MTVTRNGTQGPQGVQGAQGSQGVQGAGTQGAQGTQGFQGTAGGGGGGAGSDTTAVHYLQYDKTGVTDAGAVLQTAVDAGFRNILIPPGLFRCNTPVFDDLEDGNASLYLSCHGVQFVAGTGLPTVAEFELYNTNRGFNTGTKWFLFPSTYRAALSGGVVTTVGHNVIGTATVGGPKSGVHPHLVVDGGTWSGRGITNFNAGFAHTNTGGATELRSMHMNGARTLLGTGSNYIDGNKMRNCSAWEVITLLDSSYDMALFYQYGSGDGVEISGCKCANYILTAKLLSCNSATLASNVSGAFYLEGSHGIHIIANHCETANNITDGPRRPYYIRQSHVTIDSSFDYLSNSTTDGAVYIDDDGTEGKHSNVQIHNYFGRRFLDPATSDPVTGPAIYLNKMNDRTTIAVHNSWCQVSASDAAFGQAYGMIGLPIGGNATNEPTLAAAVAAGRDHIGSGSFKIYKYSASTVSTGQNVAMTIGVAPHGNMGRFYNAAAHVTPTSYDSEAYGATGTLTNGTAYAYAFAICNTLPDGTIEYGQATAERLITAGAFRVIITELYMPSAGAAGATLVAWRKTGTGVLSAPDQYVVLPVGSASTRLFDTGANISGTPWITTSVPVPNTVAAVNHTASTVYVAGAKNGYTDEQAQDAVAAMFAAGTDTGITFTYNDASNSMDVIATGGGGGGANVASDTIWDTKGDLAAASGPDTAAKLPVGTTLSDRLVADSSQTVGLKWVPHIVRRSGDATIITSNTVLAADDTLLWTVAANEVWSFLGVLIFLGIDTVSDFKVGWTVPSGCSMTWGAAGSQANNVNSFGPSPTGSTPLALLTESQNLVGGSGNLLFGVNMQGVVANGATPGTVNLTKAQSTSSTNGITLKANSHLILWRLA